MPEIIGHLHPLVVHLPIGILLLAVLFIFLGHSPKYYFVQAVVPLMLWLGAISAMIACITGWWLAWNDEHTQAEVLPHQYAGFITTGLAFSLAYIFPKLQAKKTKFSRWVNPLISVCLIVGIIITGHRGALMTHGENYLSFNPELQQNSSAPVADPLLFQHVIRPLLQKKCTKCHQERKRKGGLALHTLEAVLKGGKNGAVITPNMPEQSELIRRISLPADHEEFMPKGSKKALTADEIKLCTWWISQQINPPDISLAKLTISDSIQKIILKQLPYLKAISASGSAETEINTMQAPPAQATDLEILRTAGFRIKLIHRQPDLLDVVLPAGSAHADGEIGEKIKLLNKIKDNIYWLDLSNLELTDEHVRLLPQCNNLQQLNLSQNLVTDALGAKLKTLPRMRSLMVHHTLITSRLLDEINTIESLKKVFVWGTAISAADTLKNLHFEVVFGMSN